MTSHIITHVALLVDASGSIAQRGLTNTIIKAVDAQVANLARLDQDLGTETRVSIYTFADTVKCLIYDRDVMRLPSIRDHYRPEGNTALRDAVVQAIEELRAIPTKHGNHAFLIAALTDGEDTCSRWPASTVSNNLINLPSNWTVAGQVPNQTAAFALKQSGFPAGNIDIWETTVIGAETAGRKAQQATETFMRARATGATGTKNLFALDATKLSAATVRNNLTELKPSDYMILPVSRKVAIKPFVESWTKEDYRVGSAYHTLVKPEKVQAGKQVCVQHKVTGKVYAGAAARQLLGLPNHEVKVEPASHPDWNVMLQSTSSNRWLVPGTNLLVLK